jgi:SAM-dependent methyltransferase
VAPASSHEYIDDVRAYYDDVTPLVLRHVGRTYQAGLFRVNVPDEGDPYRANNLYMALRAGIRPQDRVLDAGCGWGGPAIDIATHLPAVHIDGVTLSPVQADTARSLIRAAGVDDRVSVHVGDYHALPFSQASFDVAVFFESISYAYDLDAVSREVARVLRPGGRVYFKDIFARAGELSDQERRELDLVNELYHCRLPTREALAAALERAGFAAVTQRDLRGVVTTDECARAMLDGRGQLNEFGRRHHADFRVLPAAFGEVRAHLPG